MALRAISHTLQMVFLAGGTLLLLLIVLSGSIDHFPINRFYWIEADTSHISGAPSYSRWTFWGLCSKDGSENTNCDKLAPAYPFSPVDNFGTTQNVPTNFIKNQNTFYYLTRCSWAFFLISLIFIGVSFISSLFACFWRSLRSVLTLFVSIGLLFDAAAISCETAAVVLGKNAWNDSNLDNGIGVKLMAVGWASFVVCVIAWFGTCCAAASNAFKKHKDYVAHEKMLRNGEVNNGGIIGDEEDAYPIPQSATPAPAPAQAQAQPVPSGQNQGTLASNEGGIRFFKIRRNNKGDEESE